MSKAKIKGIMSKTTEKMSYLWIVSPDAIFNHDQNDQIWSKITSEYSDGWYGAKGFKSLIGFCLFIVFPLSFSDLSKSSGHSFAP